MNSFDSLPVTGNEASVMPHPSRAAAVDGVFERAIRSALYLATAEAVAGVRPDAPAMTSAACLDLVAAVRQGALPLDDQQVLADRWLEVILRTVPFDDELGPLVDLLALFAGGWPTARLEDGPRPLPAHPGEAESSVPDPAPPPGRPRIDDLIDRAGFDAAERLQILEELAVHEVVLPVVGLRAVDAGLELVFATVERRGTPHVAAYTTQDRFVAAAAAAGHDVRRSLRVTRAELRRLLPHGHAVLMNPGSSASIALTETEIRGGRGGPALVATGGIEPVEIDAPEITGVVLDVSGVVDSRVATVDDARVVVVEVAADFEDEQPVLARVGAALLAAGVTEGVVVDSRTPIGRMVLGDPGGDGTGQNGV